VVGFWMRLGKIKCAAKALARVSACTSFNFTKHWLLFLKSIISFLFSIHVSCVVLTMTANGPFAAAG